MRRKVFGPYPCGQGRQLFADPFEVDLRFREALKCDPASVQEKAVSDSADASQAMQLLINATRFAFRLAPFDPNTGNGCTGDDVLDVWNLWADYCAKKNEPGASVPTSPQPDSSPSTIPVSGQDLASAFGSMPTG